jgi:zinc transport system permease protein
MELLTYTFVQYAFIGGTLMAILAGVLGPFVVQSRQAVASDMFAHVALAGIGAALIAGVSPWWGALPALILVSILIWWLLETDAYSPDALAMLFLSGGLALALALVHLARDTAFAFENYLFGSILTLTSAELYAIAAATLVVLATVWQLWYPLIGATQSPAYSIPFRRTAQVVRLFYFCILAVVVWIGVKTIGGLLIGALLVIPVLTVRARCRSFRQVVLGSVGVALTSVLAGLFLALYVDLPPSSLIIGVLILLFVLQLCIRRS